MRAHTVSMYVLCSPCIIKPALRAKGITNLSDLALFERAIERCKKFGIEMIPLPCPETLYLGPDRSPGTFLERLNTPEFALLLKKLERQVKQLIHKRGPPLCIIGVNSSPTCGVTSTYYGSSDETHSKRNGRGVFFTCFPDIPALDVMEFAKYKVYLASPLFSEAERDYNERIAEILQGIFFDVYLPQDTGDNTAVRESGEISRIYENNKQAIRDSDLIIAIIDGADADSGTAWEMGYAKALEKPVFALRTDFRRSGQDELVNLMLEQSSVIVHNKEELLERLKIGNTISEN